LGVLKAILLMHNERESESRGPRQPTYTSDHTIAAVAGGALLPVVVAFALRWSSPWPLDTSVPANGWARIAADAFVSQTACLVVLAPVAGVAMLQRGREAARPSGVGTLLRGLSTLAIPVVLAATALAVSSSLLQLRLTTPGAAVLLASHATLWAATVTLAALGAAAAAVFADPLDAAACALVVAVSDGAAVLVAGPVLMAVPAKAVAAALLANPIVATASAAHIDVFRTRVLYLISPLAHTRIDYPPAAMSSIWYVVVAIALFTCAALLLERQRRVSSVERTCA
jgi:hypothetical protein